MKHKMFCTTTMYHRMKHAKLSRAWKDSVMSSCSAAGTASYFDVVVMCLMGGEL